MLVYVGAYVILIFKKDLSDYKMEVHTSSRAD
jgi:hypothetical protein